MSIVLDKGINLSSCFEIHKLSDNNFYSNLNKNEITFTLLSKIQDRFQIELFFLISKYF